MINLSPDFEVNNVNVYICVYVNVYIINVGRYETLEVQVQSQDGGRTPSTGEYVCYDGAVQRTRRRREARD